MRDGQTMPASNEDFTTRRYDRRIGKNKVSPNELMKARRMETDKYTCQVCGRTAEDGARLHVHHIVPAAQGGTGDIENLVTLCSGCHRSIESGNTEKAIEQCVRRALLGAKRRFAGPKQCYGCKWIKGEKTKRCDCHDSLYYKRVRSETSKACMWFDYPDEGKVQP